MIKYGLIGENISYSYSKEIHSLFGNNEYEIYSMNKEEVKELLIKKDFLGLNVTIPYKEYVIDFLDVVDTSVELAGSCNLIICKNNKIYGYNTDFFGFLALVNKSEMNLSNKNVAILGSGGTSKTVKACLNKIGVKNIYVISRSNSDYKYEDLPKLDIDYIINTTPVGGVFNDALITPYTDNVKGVIDVIYRPNLTKLLLDAKRKKIPYVNGLYMLVYQAYLSHIKFKKEFNDPSKIEEVYHKIKYQNTNIVLIGMPFSGKSTIGKKLAQKMNRQFIDIDEEIVKKVGLSIETIFQKYGENYFRSLENEIIHNLRFENNLVISLGGGAIMNPYNMFDMFQNGIIYGISRDINNISFDGTRPLSNNVEEYKSLYLRRRKLYNKYSKRIYNNNSSIDDVVIEMERDFYEDTNC